MERQQQMADQDARADQGNANGVFSTITSQLADAKGSITLGATPASPDNTPSSARLAHLEKLETQYRDQLRSDPSNQNAAKQLAQVEAQRQRYNTTAGVALAFAGGSAGGTTVFAGKTMLSSGSLTINGGALTMGLAGTNLSDAPTVTTQNGNKANVDKVAEINIPPAATAEPTAPASTPTILTKSGEQGAEEAVKVYPYPENIEKAKNLPGTSPQEATEPAPIDNRKLIRNAQLELEVKSYQDTIDKITPMTKAAGGYVDTSHSEKGGNGKLQGTVVVKVLPQNLDAFLLKLRDLGQVQNQSVSTDDVTKDYYDTQARLENSRRMETQLQELLEHENGKVSDLLAVEREL